MITATLVRGKSYALRQPEGAFKIFKNGEPVEVTADERARLQQAVDDVTLRDENDQPYAATKPKFAFADPSKDIDP